MDLIARAETDTNNMVQLLTGFNASDVRRAREFLDRNIARARKHGVISEVAELFPALAYILLQNNPDNRSVSESFVAQLIRDIEDGRVEVNGETVVIALTGELNDGQHRCLGVLRSGKPIKTVFVFGVSRESRLTIDQGRAKTAGDFVSMDGTANGNAIAAAAGLLYQWNDRRAFSRKNYLKPTKSQIRQIVSENPGLVESYQYVHSISTRKGVVNPIKSMGASAFCHYVLAKNDKAGANEFMSRLIVGNDLSTGDPILTCRTSLQNNKPPRSQGEKALLVFNAWNAHKRHRKPAYFKKQRAIKEIR